MSFIPNLQLRLSGNSREDQLPFGSTAAIDHVVVLPIVKNSCPLLPLCNPVMLLTSMVFEEILVDRIVPLSFTDR